MGKKFQAEFSQEGVKIKGPKSEKKIGARRMPMFTMSKMPAKQGGFRPGRLVINFEFFDEDTDEMLTDLVQPIELSVRYTAADLKRAKRASEELRMGFWSGKEWVEFTPEKHNFRLEPNENPKTGGIGIVEISRWGDPPIAWCP